MRVTTVEKQDVCNLSRIPVSIRENPVYQTSLQIIDMPNIKTEDTILYKHYKEYNPVTLYDVYGGIEKLRSYSYKSCFLPWIHYTPVKDFEDVAFIDGDENSIRIQIEKIKNLIKSIQEFGYVPDKFPDRKDGHITGYWIKHEESKKFYIVSGNHRTSICFALNPIDVLPVLYEEYKHFKNRDLANRRRDILDIYDTDSVLVWPSVVEGFLTPDEAILITKKYLKEDKNGQK